MDDYDTWKRERLAELDALDRQIDDLPQRIGSMTRRCTDQLRRHVMDLNLGGHVRNIGRWVEDETRAVAAEMDRITVAPVSDDQLRAMANELDGRT